MSELSAPFQTIIDTMEGSAPFAGIAAIASDDACGHFGHVLSNTLLPRRITVRADSGARVSVVAKNRRIIKLTEVHPPELWNGAEAPEATECQNDYDAFAHPFASALVDVIGKESVQIEQGLLSEPLGSVPSGYPASMLGEHIEKSQQRQPAGDELVTFFQAHSDLPRARFGAEIEITIPTGSDISHDWMQTRIDEALADLQTTETDLRFLVLEGQSPRALALAWFDGEGVIIMSDDPETFSELEQRLHTLRDYL